MVDTVEYGIIIGRMSLKGTCGYPILILLVATSTIEVMSLLFATPIVSDVAEGLAFTTCVVRTSSADTLSVRWHRPWVDGLLEDNQLLKSLRSWKIGVTLVTIFRNCPCCTENIHCYFIGVGYWSNLTRAGSKKLRSLGRYDAWLYCVLYNWIFWFSSLI